MTSDLEWAKSILGPSLAHSIQSSAERYVVEQLPSHISIAAIHALKRPELTQLSSQFEALGYAVIGDYEVQAKDRLRLRALHSPTHSAFAQLIDEDSISMGVSVDFEDGTELLVTTSPRQPFWRRPPNHETHHVPMCSPAELHETLLRVLADRRPRLRRASELEDEMRRSWAETVAFMRTQVQTTPKLDWAFRGRSHPSKR